MPKKPPNNSPKINALGKLGRVESLEEAHADRFGL